MSFKITTTGRRDPVVIADLGASFPHPTTDLDLLLTYTVDQVATSIDVQKHLDDGNLTAKNADDNPVATILAVRVDTELVGKADSPHNLGGIEHGADTLANLNLKVSDATLIDTADSRLSDARTPTSHASSHQNAGGDEISVAGLSGELADPQPPKAHKLAGVEHNADTLANLNLKISDATLIDTNDSRLSDARTPTSHASSHQNGGGDEVSVAGLSGELADPQPPKSHKTSHENGGGDVISVAGLSGLLADKQKVAIEKAGTLVGTRSTLNFIEGSNITLTIADDSPGDEVDITIASSGGGGGKHFLPFMRIMASGGVLIMNITSDGDLNWRHMPFNKSWFSGTVTAKLHVLTHVQDAAETVYINLYSADLDETAWTKVTGSEVSYTGDTNWHLLSSGDFWANIPSGDIFLRLEGRSSTTNQTKCGEVDTDDIFWLEIQES